MSMDAGEEQVQALYVKKGSLLKIQCVKKQCKIIKGAWSARSVDRR